MLRAALGAETLTPFCGALLALCIVFSLVPTALAEKADDFTDVSRSDWYYQFVDYVTSKGYFNGTAETTFAPAENMTRAMFVTVLFRFHGAKGDSSQSAFTDVAPGEWYTAAINWAAANKIVDGVGNGKFAPNDPIIRAQMCTMIERYLDLYRKAWKVTLPETGSVSVMVDENAIPAYALAAVKQCQRHGLVNGFEDGTFRPNELSTRAQVAAVIYRMSYLVQGAKPDNTPSVNPGGTVNPPVNPPVTAYTYALYFDANGGTLIGASPVSTTTTSTTYSFPVSATATRDGYNFLGWATQTRAKSLTRHKSPQNRPSPTARRTRRPQASRPNLLNLPSPPSPRKHRRKHLRRRTPARSHCSRLSGARTARMTNFPPRAETQSTASTTRPAASMS